MSTPLKLLVKHLKSLLTWNNWILLVSSNRQLEKLRALNIQIWTTSNTDNFPKMVTYVKNTATMQKLDFLLKMGTTK